MKRGFKMRAAFVVTVASGALAGCQTEGPMTTFTPAACPMVPPLVGSPCSLANETLCYYTSACPGSFPGSFGRRCSAGVWTEVPGAACNPPIDSGAPPADAVVGTEDGGASGDGPSGD